MAVVDFGRIKGDVAVSRIVAGIGNCDPRDLPPDPEAAATPPALLARIGVDGIFAPLPPIPWLLKDLDMAPGAPTLIAGYGFTGKTIAAQALAISVASDDLDAWGLFPVRHGRVLHLDYEQGARLTCERYQRLARGYGIGPADLAGRLDVVALPPVYLDEPGAEGLLCRELDGHALCVIDPFRGAAPGADENSSRDVRHVLDAMTRASEQTGCVVVDLHHARKPTKDAPGGARMSIRGSGDFYAGHASVLIFDAPAKGGAISGAHDKARITGRCHPGFELVICDTDDGGVRVDGRDVPPARGPGAALAEIQVAILAYLTEHPGASVRKIRASVGGAPRTVGDAVALLVEDGAVRVEPGPNRTHRHYLTGGSNGS